MRGSDRQVEAMQLERETKLLELDPYGELLEPPKSPEKEYTSFDGGVDLVKMGLASPGQTRTTLKKKGKESADEQEAGEGSADFSEASFCH